MNPVIQTMQNHRSFRNYLDKPVTDEHLQMIIESAQWAPSWIHGQQVSIILIRDTQRKETLAELVGNQKYVAQASVFLVFCVDFYRAYLAGEQHELELGALEDVDLLMVGATDVGLAMSNAITAAESLGLGTVPIGGIRRNPLQVIELLDLPKYVIPISGLCVGYPAHDPGQKPRLPKEAVVHEERYHHDIEEMINTYDETIRTYNAERSNGEDCASWSERVASFYKRSYYQDIAEMLHKQGFSCLNVKHKKDEE